MKDETFIKKNLALVYSLAARFKDRNVEYEEVVAAGAFGLVKAAQNFDPDRGFAFSTYAVPVILGEMRRLFRDGTSVKVGRGLKELSAKAAGIREEYIQKNGREPQISEVAKLLNVSPFDAVQALCVTKPVLSLSDETGEEMDLAVPAEQNNLVDRMAVYEMMKKLEPLERKLIFLRYFQGKTQMQTAKLMNVTQVWVSRREKKTLLQLRSWME